MLLCHSQGLISTNHKEPESVFNRWQLLSFPMWKMVNSEEGFEKQKDATLMHYCTDDVPNRSSVQLPMATKIPASANRTAAKTCRSFQTRSQTFAHCGYFFLFVLNGSFWTSLPADYFVNSKAPNHTSACDMAPGRNFHLPTVRVCKHPWNHMQIRKKKKKHLHPCMNCRPVAGYKQLIAEWFKPLGTGKSIRLGHQLPEDWWHTTTEFGSMNTVDQGFPLIFVSHMEKCPHASVSILPYALQAKSLRDTASFQSFKQPL